MKTKIIISIVSLALVIASVIVTMGFISNQPTPEKSRQQTKSLTVKASKVSYSKQVLNFDYQGRVQAYENISLSAEVSGKIQAGTIPFKEGQAFNKGSLLIHIFDEDIKASIKASKSKYLQTISLILPDMKVDFPERYDEWNNFFNAIDIDKNLPDLPETRSDKERVFLASNNILSDYYTLKQQEITLSKYNIYAPFNGYFKTVNREVGAIATGGTELASIVRSDILEIVVPVLPDDIKRLKKGDIVKIKNNASQSFEGKISRIADFIDVNTQSVNVYITFNQKQEKTLLEGEFVNVSFRDKQVIDGMQIPREAVLKSSQAYVIDNGKLKLRKVNIIRQSGDSVTFDGLDEGELVVTESLINVKEGMPVEAM